MHALGGEEVLDAERNAFQRPALPGRKPRVGGFRHVARLLRRLDDIGVEHAGLFHGGEIGVGEFKRCELLASKAVAGGGDGEGGKVAHDGYSTTFGTMKKSSSCAGALATIFCG